MAKCVICFGHTEAYNGVFTPCCNTTYCKKCLAPWLEVHHSCPQCRKNLANISETIPMDRILSRLNIQTEHPPSKNDIDEFIENAAKSNRDVADFKKDFEETLQRTPSFKEINAFVKLQGQSRVLPKKTSQAPISVNLPIRFISDGKSRGVFTVTGRTCVWNKDGRDWAIIDTEMQSGIYSLVGKINDRSTWFGVMSKHTLLTENRDQRLFKAPGQCCFGYFGDSDYIIGGGNTILYQEKRGALFPLSGKASVRLELNLDTRVLFFFVGGKQLLHCVTNIPPCVYFAMDAKFAGSTFTVTSLTKLAAPTVSNTNAQQCTIYQWE